MRTLIDILRERAATEPDRRAYVFLDDGEREGEALTHAALDRRARAIAEHLRRHNCVGEPVLLLCHDGLDYIAGFFGCLYAGAIAVPAYPPRHPRRAGRVQAMVEDCRPRAVLATSDVQRAWRNGSLNGIADLVWIRIGARDAQETPHVASADEHDANGIDEPAIDEGEAWMRPSIEPHTPAFLQYTSGSTASPRGVIVTHGSLLHNQKAMRRAFAHRGAAVGWLPMHHDMGLIGNVLHSLYAGVPMYLMSPTAFLQRPARWLDAIQRFGATTSGGPNFAYELCVRAIGAAERAALDLSTWEIAFCGAEPIRSETLARFAEAFRPAGFRPAAFYPCYGLAEATLFVAGGPRLAGARVEAFDRRALERTHAAIPAGVQALPAEARRLVSCGLVADGYRIEIVDPDTHAPRERGQIGEIWLAGPSVALGYWQRPGETADTFRAYTATGDGPFLRTGDLGFRHGSPEEMHLFVTGRAKDLIIIRGRNHYPQDIEHTVSSADEALQPDGAAAFAIEVDDEERLAVVQELALRRGARPATDAAASAGANRRQENALAREADGIAPEDALMLDRIVARIRDAVIAEHDIAPTVVCLIAKGMLPRTSSGKVQRALCRERLENGALDALYTWRDTRPGISATLSADDVPRVRSRSTELPDGRIASGSWLQELVAGRLRVPATDLDHDAPLARYGLDSLIAVELVHDIAARTGRSLAVASLLDGATLTQIARQLADGDVATALPARPLLATTAVLAGHETSWRDAAPANVERELSSGERAMLVAEALGNGQPVYHLARACRLVAPFTAERSVNTATLEALERAFAALVARHPALRTTFPRVAGRPVPRVHDTVDVRLLRVDLDDISDGEFHQRLEADSRRPFALDREPPWRATLFVRSGREAVLLLVFHHIAVDLWSLTILARELGTLPDVQSTSLDVDVARLELEALSERQAALDAHWARVLRQPIPRLELPTDRPRPALRRFAGDTLTAHVDADVTVRVKRLAQQEAATTQSVLLAMFQSLLHGITGQDDLLVGIPANRRLDARLRDVVGYLVNPVVIRANARDDPSFRTAVRRVRTAVAAAVAHQDYPFPLLVDRFVPVRDGHRLPLIEAMFVMQQLPSDAPAGLMPFVLNQPGEPFALGGMLVEPVPIDLGVAAFDLTLTVGEVGGTFTVTLQYDTDLFEASTAGRWLTAYVDLLSAATETPDRAVSQLVSLSSSSSPSVVATADTCPATPARLDEVFRAQARRAPNAIAITDDTREMTYAELDARSSRLAARLKRLGVTPDSFVALFLDRSADLIVAMLAVSKANAAYVPIDPAYPAERVRYILDDTRAPVVCAHRRTLASLPATRARTLLVDDDDADAVEAWQAASSADGGGLGTLAYVIYTSGSTGQPKGVLVTHANVLRLFETTMRWFAFGVEDTWTLFHSAAFDFSVWEIWGALLHGGRLVVVPHAVARSPEAFHDLLARERVTVLNQTPSAFRGLAAVDERRDARALSALRLVVFGGEALEPSQLRAWVARHGDERPHLVNMYGITETTVHVTYRRLRAADVAGARGSAIGVPLPDLTLRVLDADFAEQPVGVEGELFVGGAGVARGYLNRPDLTAARFLPDPSSSTPGARWYRSGDRGRRLADGDVEYLGRVDAQIKIRGHRIEPGEIEAALRQHAAITDAVVVARSAADDEGLQRYEVGPHESGGFTPYRIFLKDAGHVRAGATASSPGGPSSDAVLVAYVVPRPGARLAIDELRQSLAAVLPEMMIPAAFVMLDRLPLTAHGKLDRAALPAPSGVRPTLGRELIPARTPVESALAAIWSDVLGVAPVGVEDNFFDLGGDSIRALQVQARAAEGSLLFSLQEMLRHQTIAAMSAIVEGRAIEGGTGTQAPSAGPTIALTMPFSSVSEMDRQRMPAEIVDAYPLSRIQAGMFYHMHLSPGTGMYHDLFFYGLRVTFDETCLRQAVQACMDRHPVLRSSFDFARFSEPLQLVRARVEAQVEILDWRVASLAEQEARRRAWIDAELPRPADPAAPTQIRVFVHRLTDEAFDLVLSFYDVIFDGWSTSTVLSEIITTYAGLLAGRPIAPTPAPPAVTYRDFVALERATIANADAEAFWRNELTQMSPLPPPRWETARTDNEAAPPCIRALDVTIDDELSQALDGVARQVGVPLKHVLLAAHQRVMSALAGQWDVVTGLESNGRLEMLDGDRTVGIHVNTVPLRQRLRPGSWATLMRQTFENETRILPYRRYPLFDLHRQRGLAGGEAIVESVFNYTHFHLLRPAVQLGTLSIRGAFGYEQTNFPFRAEFNRNPFTERTQLDLVVNAAEIGEAQAREIAAMYLQALRSMATDPGRRHDTLSLLPRERVDELVHAGTGADIARTSDELLHQLVEAQADRTPDAIALVYDGRRLTYAELDAQAAQLALRLQSHGVGADILVAVLMERSLEMVVALLGVLKAGGAFVPVDPGHPHERVRVMLEEARPVVLLVQREGQEHPIARTAPCPTLCVEIVDREIRAASPDAACAHASAAPTPAPERPVTRTFGSHLAYVLFTSGSTGQPKAAMNTHAGIVNRLRWMQERCPLAADDRVLQKTPFTFDVSIPEIFWPLMTGGCLVIARPAGHRDPAYLADVIRAQAITTVHFVPSMLQAFLAQDDLETSCQSLRRMTCSGEALPLGLQERLLRRLPVEVYNLYGPTEAAVEVSWWRCDPTQDRGTVPIGFPIANTRLLVLDEALQPAPLGVAGDLYIGGVALARGYLRHPDWTADAFVPDPFDRAGGGRLYRTGDRARLRPDFAIEFLGRRDQQVKVRGVRVELGEIERALSMHAAVRGATVTAVQERDRTRLVAYVVLAHAPANGSGAATLEHELRRWLRTRLPDAMVPSAFVLLETLPQTSSGKVDRRALPAPPTADEPVSAANQPTTSVRTPTEEMLAGLWSDCLRRPISDVHEDFFDAGGDSLIATQLVSRVRAAFGVDLPLRALFEAPTVAALAVAIDAARREQTGVQVSRGIAGALGPRPSLLPLSFAQERLLFLAQSEPDSLAYGNPGVLRLTGPMNVDALWAVIDAIVARHESLRTTFILRDGVPVQVIADAVSIDVPVIDLSHLSMEARTRALHDHVRREATRPFDLSAGPLLRVLLLRFEEEEHAAIFAIHHIVSDAWSLGLFVDEAARLYRALSAGRAEARNDRSDDLPLQYADFALWQRAWLTGDRLDRLRRYWAETLRALPAFELPTDRPRGAALTHRGARQRFNVSRSTAAALLAIGRQDGVTLFMTTLAAFAVLLHVESGLDDVAIGTDVANRTRGETERLIGFFVNQLVLRVNLRRAATFEALLHHVRDVALAAYDHQELPFEQVVEIVNPPRARNRTPLFQVKLVFQNAPQRPLEIGDLRIEILDIDHGTAKFDLLVDVWETPDGLAGTFEYRTELFESSTIERLRAAYVWLLDEVAIHPTEALSSVIERLRSRESSHRRDLEQHRRLTQRAGLKHVGRRQPGPQDAARTADRENL